MTSYVLFDTMEEQRKFFAGKMVHKHKFENDILAIVRFQQGDPNSYVISAVNLQGNAVMETTTVQNLGACNMVLRDIAEIGQSQEGGGDDQWWKR